MIIAGTPSFANKALKCLPVYPPVGYIAIASPPNFFMALATFIPPPPGSSFGAEHLISFLAQGPELKCFYQCKD